ncbi:hypothetical protein PtrM4_052430 [Pyrenophora tritici-repentis]|uniref:Uncharacterized protein n=1 Tax=Pyrenophora tritici-repentis TaxID=45151 RepID=A0A834VK34_9PLEO|nr:hypothetical protein A1F99_105120 [Pyrenophora tritici-repentis]KAF7565809.1 hypothetical protein PtrM4_052430 [Pyrenophora tritici-repentis]
MYISPIPKLRYCLSLMASGGIKVLVVRVNCEINRFPVVSGSRYDSNSNGNHIGFVVVVDDCRKSAVGVVAEIPMTQVVEGYGNGDKAIN